MDLHCPLCTTSAASLARPVEKTKIWLCCDMKWPPGPPVPPAVLATPSGMPVDWGRPLARIRPLGPILESGLQFN